MKIVIIGGTGLIGSKLTTLLTAAGHQPLPAAPSTGVDTVTGEGLAAALQGASAVVDVTNPKSWDADVLMNFFTTSTRNLLAAEKAAGVTHHIALSVIGADQMDSAYMRAKVAQEKLIQQSGAPYTLVRAAQFYEFLPAIADFSTVDGAAHLPPVFMQPLAAADVSAELAKIATAAPANGIVEVAGPEKLTIAQAIERTLKANNDPRKVVTDPTATYYGAKVKEGTLIPANPNPRLGATSFSEWINM